MGKVKSSKSSRAKWSPIWDRKDLPLWKRKELIQQARFTPPSKKASSGKKYPHLQKARLS